MCTFDYLWCCLDGADGSLGMGTRIYSKSAEWLGWGIEWNCRLDKSFAVCKFFDLNTESVRDCGILYDVVLGSRLLEDSKKKMADKDIGCFGLFVGYASFASIGK